jgi:DNA polymerase III subunit epsilon
VKLPWRRAPSLSADLARRVAAWKALPEPAGSTPVEEARWVVVDVETSGLDATRDRLISIGALGLRGGVADFGDSFEVVLRQARPSDGANIEVHGIGGSEQTAGMDPALALVLFLEFIGKAPLVAFRARFDEEVLRRAVATELDLRFARRWLDLADVAPLAWPGRVRGGGLDEWLHAFGIPMVQRHRAIVDCLATAQLFAAVVRDSGRLGAASTGSLLALSGQGRWL